MKEDMIVDIKKACCVELICMPLFLYTYTPDLLCFWIILILMDSYILKHVHFIEFTKQIDKISKRDQNTLHALSFGILLAMIVIAFKNIKLAGYLLLNDIIIDGISILYDFNKIKKG